MTNRIRCTVAAIVLLVGGCGGEGGGPNGPPQPPPGPPPQQTIQFTALPMALADLANIFPLGNVSPPGHTFPSDHVGLTHTAQGSGPIVAGRAVIYAPAGGYVLTVFDGLDDGIAIGPQPPNEMGADRTYYTLGHINLDPGIQVGTQITAGQRLGVNSGFAFGVDFGLADNQHENAFVRPERYGQKQRNGVKPLSRFTPTLRAQLAAKVDREGANDEEGTFVYDVPNRLIGNWFHESLPYTHDAETSPANWSKHLAFVETPTIKGERVIAIGGFTTGDAYLFYLEPDAPDFAAIPPASGKVVFRTSITVTRWWLLPMPVPNRHVLVEMTGPETLTFELFEGSTPPTDFTAAAAVFKR